MLVPTLVLALAAAPPADDPCESVSATAPTTEQIKTCALSLKGRVEGQQRQLQTMTSLEKGTPLPAATPTPAPSATPPPPDRGALVPPASPAPPEVSAPP